MERSDQVTLIERALRHIAEKTTDRGEPFEVRANFYNDQAQLEREKLILFRDFPFVVGFSSQVRTPGDFFVFEFGKESILVVRDHEGRLRAFANFCRHRGMRLAQGSGNVKAFVCPYHAWSYGTNGDLKAAPHSGNFRKLGDCKLKSYPVGEKCGLVWVKPILGNTFDLEQELGGLSDDLTSFGFDSHVQFEPRSFRLPFNWKLMIEASLETYHFKSAHRKTIASMFFDDLGVFDWKAPHGRLFLPKQKITDFKMAPREKWNIRDAGNIVYFFFPNTIFLVQPDHATWMSVYPISERESFVYGGTLIPPAPLNETSTGHWQKNVEIFWKAIGEDFAMSEGIQKGLDSETVDEIAFGSTEYLIRHFHDEIRQACKSMKKK
ncbi:MAG: aromatic ring-hydroxylating dioxygenase subunit alpha [Bdellovibrionales bacterium]